MFSYKNFTYIFILLIFTNTSQGQFNSEKYICIEKSLFQISMEAKKYYNELNNSYSINVTPSHLVFFLPDRILNPFLPCGTRELQLAYLPHILWGVLY